ncbi:DUF998 domain-containing protein [Microbacterium esteraromaticum]|uniref:DUF998 domain-containing protein n=1 Tax=Microbacterium esteraromaticum TaxID=57043 RepID=A0A7D7WBG6_9MICO|nr:DUF998 domain-containing protein [Microbacterium esteraromaticum]QMU97558.1 DUF998 domain-containing protein [Microbacterium esteraromaticum]
MTQLRDRARTALKVVRRLARSAESIETAALIAGAAAFVVGFPISWLIFGTSRLSITGPGSIGSYAAVGGAVVAAVAFALGRLAVRPEAPAPDEPRDGFVGPPDRLRWYDLFAIGGAYASIALLGWFGIAQLLELSFIGAPVFAFPGAILVGVAFALTAYVAFHGALRLTPMSLSLDLAVFLVVGAFAAMLTSSDPQWWQNNLSALGQTTNSAAPAFNVTLILSGLIVTTIARYATAGLPVDTTAERRSRTLTRGGLVIVGVFLALVGVFPVDRFFLVHNTVATGMAVVYALLVVALPKLLPGLPRVFYALGYVYVGVVALLGVFFATGYYNLTAVELIAGVLIFSWIIVFLRTVSAAGTTGAESPAAAAAGAVG